MILPALMPLEFAVYASAKTEQELFEQLVANPIDLILFIVNACEDETWCGQNGHFLKLAFEWLDKRFLEGRLSTESTEKIAYAIQPHFEVLKHYLPESVLITQGGEKFAMNALLLGASSDLFHEIIRTKYRLHQPQLTIDSDISHQSLILIKDFISQGEVSALWRTDKEVLLQLLKDASKCHFRRLVNQCEAVLKRYIDRDSAVDMTVLAYKESWHHLLEHCCEFINEQHWGVKLGSENKIKEEFQKYKPLSFEFINFGHRVLEVFSALRFYITHLVFGGDLTQDPSFSIAVQSCPRLKNVDISQTHAFSERLLDLPEKLAELELARCPWLTNIYLKKVITICPFLNRLNLSSNTQITFLGWAELLKLTDLTSLDLSRCHQLNDADFSIILRSCGRLMELNVEECSHLLDPAFFEISRSLPALTYFHAGRTHITDAALLEIAVRCKALQGIDLTRCKGVTEKGLIQVLKLSPKLKYLIIKNSRISDQAIAQFKKVIPSLAIID